MVRAVGWGLRGGDAERQRIVVGQAWVGEQLGGGRKVQLPTAAALGANGRDRVEEDECGADLQTVEMARSEVRKKTNSIVCNLRGEEGARTDLVREEI